VVILAGFSPYTGASTRASKLLSSQPILLLRLQ